jgi:hypothetical protein
MWIIQEPNNVALWNKRHFEERKTEIMQYVYNIQYGYLLNKYLKGAGLVAWEAAEYIYSARTESVKKVQQILKILFLSFHVPLSCKMYFLFFRYQLILIQSSFAVSTHTFCSTLYHKHLTVTLVTINLLSKALKATILPPAKVQVEKQL